MRRYSPHRPALLAISMLSSSMAYAQCTEKSFTISFSEYPQNTSISTQYANDGVLFASGGGYPFISPDGSNPTAPVLSGTPQFAGPITAVFVNPSDVNTAASTTALTFDAGYFDEVGSTSVTFNDINNAPLSTVTNQGLGIISFTAPVGTHSFTISSGADSAGFAIDNLAYTLGKSSALKIDSPTMGSAFALDQNTQTRSSDITFQASGTAATGQVSWDVLMEYDTDSPRGLPSLPTKFNTNGTGAKKFYYQSQGGRGRVSASSGSNASPTMACPIEYFYVVGSDISPADITARLVALYPHGATPRLLTGIAHKESTYRQFSLRTKYGQNALWPLESSQDGGSHVGLMQVAVSAAYAWDWQQNSASAADLFQEKLRIASSLERRIRQQNHGLRALTDLENENMALTLYGPSAAAGVNNQYYRAIQLPNGTFDWVINTDNNAAGVAYADSVRNQMQ